MKKFFGLFLILILAIATFAGSIQPPTGWYGQLWSSTFALYGTKGKMTHFLCTADPIEKIPGGYRLLSAGHCVQLSPDGLAFSVSEEIGGPKMPVSLVKARLDNESDFAIFDLQTTKEYFVFPLGDEHDTHVGDETVNPNFALGVTKQLSLGNISSDLLGTSEACKIDDGCADTFLVHEQAGQGASGSAVLSVKTHQIIGLLVWEFEDGNIGYGLEPISKFAKFMVGPNQPHPGTKATIVEIPADVLVAQFGPKHAFKLTVHGPNPTFTQAGYKFRVETDGLELEDKYYYNSKVFIGQDEDGYRLVSMHKEHFSVDLTVLGKD